MISRPSLAPVLSWIETAYSKSPFTQFFRVAFAAMCKCDNPSGNQLFNDLVGAAEAVNVFYCPVVSIRHQLNV